MEFQHSQTNMQYFSQTKKSLLNIKETKPKLNAKQTIDLVPADYQKILLKKCKSKRTQEGSYTMKKNYNKNLEE